MPSKKKKYNARFPPVSDRKNTCWIVFEFSFLIHQARIKKIMQTDEEVGKVAAAVPVIIYILSHE